MIETLSFEGAHLPLQKKLLRWTPRRELEGINARRLKTVANPQKLGGVVVEQEAGMSHELILGGHNEGDFLT